MRAFCKTMLAASCAGLLSAVLFFPSGIASAAEDEIRILALGDSLTHGYGLANGDEFPAQLERALAGEGLNVSVINAGVSGDTSAGGLARLDWSLGDNPDVAIVELGGNDALRGLSPVQTEQSLDAIFTRLAEEGVPALLAGMLSPRNMGPEYTQEFDSVYSRVAEKHGVIFYPFFLEGVALEPSLMQGDGTHANADGVAEIVRRMLPLVLELIAQTDTPA